MTDWANAQYELRVATEADEDGDYLAHVYVDGRYTRCKLSQNRDVAIARAKDWVAWRRATVDGEEVIPL